MTTISKKTCNNEEDENTCTDCLLCEPIIKQEMTPNDYMDMLQHMSRDKTCPNARNKYTKYFSFVIMSWPYINAIVNELKETEEPIVEVMAGAGWLSYFINCISDKKVIPSDICSKEDSKRWFQHDKSYAPVDMETIDAIEHIEKVKPRTLIMSWPTNNSPIAYQVVKRFVELGGTKLLYHGDVNFDRGCCGTFDFFAFVLCYEFKEIVPYDNLDRWNGFYDHLLLFDFTKFNPKLDTTIFIHPKR